MFHDIAHALMQLTENKLVVSIIPVVIGAGLLSWWLKIRDRRIAVRDETLRFVNETADLLNRGISPLFRAIRAQSVEKLDLADSGIADLFEHRLSTRARSIALLGAPEFSKEYESIVWQLREMVDEFRVTVRSAAIPSAAGDTADPILPVAPLWDTFLEDAKNVWNRAAVLITAGIETGIRGRRQRIHVHALSANARSHLRND
jgi:hypothetical protein